MDKTLINMLGKMARHEKKVKEFKRRMRVKGKIIKKGLTKKGSIKLIVTKEDDKFNFIIIKTHKDKYVLAEKLKVGDFVYAEGINKFRAIICTKLKQIKTVDESRQVKLENF